MATTENAAGLGNTGPAAAPHAMSPDRVRRLLIAAESTARRLHAIAGDDETPAADHYRRCADEVLETVQMFRAELDRAEAEALAQ